MFLTLTVQMKKLFFFICSFIILLNLATAHAFEKADSTVNIIKQSDSIRISPFFLKPSKTYLIGNIKLGKEIPDLQELKVEAALTLAGGIIERFKIVPLNVRDSVAQKIVETNKVPTVSAIAEKLDIDRILFVNINRVENMLRVDIVSVDAKDMNSKTEGTGYALLHFINEKTDKEVYDPTLLAAVQRAIAVCESDSSLYKDAPGKFNVVPAPTLVIGGIDFQDDKEYPLWDLYARMPVSSYDMVQTIFEAARDSRDYVVYDIDTRDTIYAMFKLIYVENYSAPTKFELEILNKFQVDYYLSGTFKRIKGGAELELSLNKIEGEKLRPLKSEKGELANDDLYKLRDLVKSLTKKLMNL
jgi:hypothetical protein